MHWGHPCRDKVSLFAGDIGLVSFLTVAGWYLSPSQTRNAAQMALSLTFIIPTFVAAIYVFDLYGLAEFDRVGTLFKVGLAVGTASLLCIACFHVLQWPHRGYRSLELCALVLAPAIYLWRRSYLHSSSRLRRPERLLVVGRPKDAEILNAALGTANSRYRLAGLVETEPDWTSEIEGRMSSEMAEQFGPARGVVPVMSSLAAGVAVAMAAEPATAVDVMDFTSEVPAGVDRAGLATSESLLRMVTTRSVSTIVVRSDAMTSELAGMLTRLRFNGIQVYSLLDFCMRTSEELPLEVLNEFWLCVAEGFDLLQARFFRRVKRVADVLMAAAGLVAALPIMVIAALAIRLDSPGPVLFRQRRVGWMGRPFELLKFRSMRMAAEKEGKPQWAAVDDPRITRIGRILRKTHLDELPQMINILRGEMSFVGPRPERPEFVGVLKEAIRFYDLRHYVLPGITGWAQVNYPYGASIEDARRKLQYDLYYVCNASPLLDVRTMLRTARVMLFRWGSR